MTASLLGQGPGGFGRHAALEFGIQQSGNKDAARTTGRKGKLEARSSQSDGVDTTTVDFIPSRDNDTGLQIVLVLINETFHQMSRGLDSGLTTSSQTPLTQKVVHVVRQGLRIGRTSTATAIDAIGDLNELVGNAIGNVGSRRRSRVGAHNHSTLKGKGHDGGAGHDFAIPVLGIMLLLLLMIAIVGILILIVAEDFHCNERECVCMCVILE
mmetsp:Transcript_23951/g.68172  ORF Transcript_23951/g.68172 Transcript_23951/m.68172 type:complete len:212 (-) Transcript_23951:53-688(-)